MQHLSTCTEHTMKNQCNLTKLLTAFSKCLALAVSAPVTSHSTALCTGKSLVFTWRAGRTPQVCLVQPEIEHLLVGNTIFCQSNTNSNNSKISSWFLYTGYITKLQKHHLRHEIQGQGVLQSQEHSALTLSSHGLVGCWNQEQAWKRTVRLLWRNMDHPQHPACFEPMPSAEVSVTFW